MVDELIDTRACRVCGGPIHANENTEQLNNDLCTSCALAGQPEGQLTSAPQDLEADAVLTDETAPPQPDPDPDNPRWGPLAGLGTWAFSIAASIIIPLIPLLILMFVKAANGANAESLREWAESPSAVLVLLIATFPAQAVIMLFCWAVVTRWGKRPFFESLGWHWAGRSAIYWGLVSFGIVIALELVTNFLLRFLPERTSPFEEMLKSSQPIRVTTVLLAVLTAPLVEEIVYRGVLFSALRKRLSAAATVALVTLVFVGVHVPQYLGAWRTIAALSLLSFALTIVRAQTSSVLPSFLIHLINNSLSSIFILFHRD